jgi:hypothetical protein
MEMPSRCSIASGWSVAAQMQIGLEMPRLRIDGDVVAEPSEFGRLILDDGGLPQFQHALETFHGYRHPHAPAEVIVHAEDRNLQNAANENIPLDKANVAVELANFLALFLRHFEPVIRSLERHVEQDRIELPSATATGPGVVHVR